jgi:hypothetical protein
MFVHMRSAGVRDIILVPGEYFDSHLLIGNYNITCVTVMEDCYYLAGFPADKAPLRPGFSVVARGRTDRDGRSIDYFGLPEPVRDELDRQLRAITAVCQPSAS